MHYRRSRPRDKGSARSKSSDWRYPQVEKGSGKRSTASTKRKANLANDELLQHIITDSLVIQRLADETLILDGEMRYRATLEMDRRDMEQQGRH